MNKLEALTAAAYEYAAEYKAYLESTGLTKVQVRGFEINLLTLEMNVQLSFIPRIPPANVKIAEDATFRKYDETLRKLSEH